AHPVGPHLVTAGRHPPQPGEDDVEEDGAGDEHVELRLLHRSSFSPCARGLVRTTLPFRHDGGGRMRLTIIGGGGFRVPLIFRALARDPEPVIDELVLYDSDGARLR